MFNDVEDADDDYHDLEKRARNPISSGHITRRQSYLLSFLILFAGVSILVMVNSLVFYLGIIFALVGFFYSWKPLRLKSKPVWDLVSHIIFLGVLQFLITYFAFRPPDLSVTPFLLIIVPFSVMNEILHEFQDFDVDQTTEIRNTVQRFERSGIKRLLTVLMVLVAIGFSIVIFTIPSKNWFLNVSLTTMLGTVAVLRLNARISII